LTGSAGAAALTLFFALLIGLPVLASQTGNQSVALMTRADQLGNQTFPVWRRLQAPFQVALHGTNAGKQAQEAEPSNRPCQRQPQAPKQHPS